MKIEANVDDNDVLRIDVGNHGVTVAPAGDAEACRLAIDHLMEMLAGVSKHELMMAAYRAVHGEQVA